MAHAKARPQPEVTNQTNNGQGRIDNASLAEVIAPDHDIPPEVEEIESPDRQRRVEGVKNLLLSGEEDDDFARDEIVLEVSFRRPHDTQIYRINPDPTMTGYIHLMDFRGAITVATHGLYAFDPAVLSKLPRQKVRRHRLYEWTTPDGKHGLWPIKVTEGWGDQYYKNALIAIERARGAWCQLESQGRGMPVKCHRMRQQDWGIPKWSGMSLAEMVVYALSEYYIDDPNHLLVTSFQYQEQEVE
jgi:hypothetical protein